MDNEKLHLFNFREREGKAISPIEIEKLNNHIVLIGYGRLGKHISKFIQKEGLEFIVIEGDIQTVKEAQMKHLPVIFGNAAQKNILESVNIKEALSKLNLTHIVVEMEKTALAMFNESKRL